MSRLPRQVTRFIQHLAAATRDAERQWIDQVGPSESVAARGEVVGWVIHQMVTRGSSPARPRSVTDEVNRSKASCQRDFPFASLEASLLASQRLRELLESNDLPLAAQQCAEYMGAGSCQFPPGDYLVELFLAAYDQEQRKRRGVYYTPWPLVQYLVRSVDVLLRDVLHVPEGLATLGSSDGLSPVVVDPACGTGLFLRAVLRQVISGSASELDSLASTAARDVPLPGADLIQGFDVLPAVISAGHDLLAWEFPQIPSAGNRLHCRSALNREADQWIDSVRHPDAPLVILGNPPYANFGRANRDPWILELMQDYRTGLGERKHNLHDDTWKFLRWSQYQVERAGRGIVALVLNHALLDGLTHRCLRTSLLSSFDQLYFYNLHGSRWRPSEATGEDGTGRDENVFGVRCGITLCLLVRSSTSRGIPTVHYAEIQGSRQRKLEQLGEEAEEQGVGTTSWLSWTQPLEPPDGFEPRKATRTTRPGECQATPGCERHGVASGAQESRSGPWDAYGLGWGLDEIFAQYVSGVQTKRDALFTDRHADALAERMRDYATERRGPHDEEPVEFDSKKLRPYMVAPFDLRWIYYEPRWLGRARFDVMRHLLVPETFENLALVFMRQSTNPGLYDHFLVTRHLLSDRVFHSGHGAPYAAPLFLLDDSGTWRGNFQDDFIRSVESELGIPYVPEAVGRSDSFGPRDLLAYLYGVAYSPSYRHQFAEELPRGFPRIPRPKGLESFRAIGRLGNQLVQLHGNVGPLADISTQIPSKWERATDCVVQQSIPQHPVFRDLEVDIPRPVWEKRIGGVAVIPRWLKQRGRDPLHAHERAYLSRLVEICEQTLTLEQQLDRLSELEGRPANEVRTCKQHPLEEQSTSIPRDGRSDERLPVRQ
jgi:hypothetical protein